MQEPNIKDCWMSRKMRMITTTGALVICRRQDLGHDRVNKLSPVADWYPPETSSTLQGRRRCISCTPACAFACLFDYPLACLCWLPPWRPIWGTTRGRPVDWYIGQWPTSTPRKTRLGRLPNCLLVCVPWLVPTTHSYLNDSAIILYHGNQHCIEPQSAVVGLPRNFVLWRTLLGLCHWLHY